MSSDAVSSSQTSTTLSLMSATSSSSSSTRNAFKPEFAKYLESKAFALVCCWCVSLLFSPHLVFLFVRQEQTVLECQHDGRGAKASRR